MTESLQDRVVGALGQQYELDSEIGRGGMSVVYRARDVRLNRPVAIKVLPPELAHDAAIRTRFTREAQTAAQLAHAHIVPIYDVGERNGIAYFVMALVAGGNVGGLLARQPRQPIDDVRRLLGEVADALAYAHVRGVIHRDIKPDNILLDGNTGRAMVTDFGIAQAMEAGQRLTATGIAVGTPTYMSPEQAVGERDLDGRSDIYSLGILGYQMLTGRVPFTAGNSMALLLKHVSERPRPIEELRPETPRPLREAIERAIMKAPEDRWPTAGAFREALLSDKASSIAWRVEPREPVRYTSPRPDSVRVVPRSTSPRRGSATVERPPSAPAIVPNVIDPEAPHLAVLTPEQRADLRLWHGRVHLLDRVKTARAYFWSTLGAIALGVAGFAAGIAEEMPPLVFSPIVPLYMTRKMWLRRQSLRLSGLKLRRVVLMPRARWVLPAPPKTPNEHHLAKLAPREVLDGRHGAAVRQAVEDRATILGIMAGLSKADRALLPDVKPTADALVERVAQLAHMVHRLEQSIDHRAMEDLDARIAEADREGASLEGERRLAFLRRQRGTFDDLVKQRDALARQLESAGLALGSLRLDLIKLRSSGLQSALADVSTATQEARALSRDIARVLDAAAEVKSL